MNSILSFSKKLFLSAIVAFALTINIQAQAPDAFSYQSVIRNANGVLHTNNAVGVKISLLQGSTSGTAVYEETHTSTTNANGLLTLEVGNGTVLSGTFANINWANGPYFIQTEIDLNGGSNYTLSGTVQLMSVPYALFAKNSGDAFDGDYNSLVNVPTEVSHFTNDANYINTEIDGDTTNELITGLNLNGTTLEITEAGTTHQVNLGSLQGSGGGGTTYSIGDTAFGGVIFWLEPNGMHGLVAAPSDISTGIQWFNGTFNISNIVRDGIYAGIYNTERIITTQGAGQYAAQICANHNGGGYGDWYLPSLQELILMYNQQTVIGGFAAANYWSSTQNASNTTWGYSFSLGAQVNISYNSATPRVRPIRRF